MAYSESGTIDGDDTNAYNLLIDRIVLFVSTLLPVAERHTVNRNTTEANTLGDLANAKVVLLQAPGMGGTDQIFYGMKVYKHVSSDYYNCQINAFTGYASGNNFENQPGNSMGSGSTGIGVTLWNQDIPYWLVANGQGFVCVIKVSTTYVTFGAGFHNKYATFGQYPYPMVVYGNLVSASATRFSDSAWRNGWKGNRANLRMRDVSGTWLTPQCIPYQNSENVRNTNTDSNVAAGYYGLHPIELSDATGTGNVYGMLENLFYVSGFNNTVENTLTAGGITYVVMRDGVLTGNNDFVALKMLV